VKKIFLRSSGVLKAIPNAESINLLPLSNKSRVEPETEIEIVVAEVVDNNE